MVVSEMNLEELSESALSKWFDELLDAYDYIVDEYDLTAPQLHDALVSLELGKNIGGLPVDALEKMHHSEIGHVDASWLRLKPNSDSNPLAAGILKRDLDGNRYLTVGRYILSPMGQGYWSIEKQCEGDTSLIAAWVTAEDVRKKLRSKPSSLK